MEKANLTVIANWKFQRMSKAAKRVQIAHDVLALIKARRFFPAGVYLYDHSGILYKNPNSQMSLLMKSATSCDVCAVGAIFLGFANRMNNCTIKKYVRSHHSGIFMKKYLLDYFSDQQIQMIETAFEQSIISVGGREYSNLEWQQLAKSKYFAKRTKNPKNRMIKIMKNIIENNGTFVP